MRTIVLDTNVLLADPGVLFAYPDAEIVLPETVLGEIDKLKLSRVDPELRFRGREVSRMLFELSEQGNLLEGVELENGARLRIRSRDSDIEYPEGLSSRNADDRILAAAYSTCRDGCDDLTLVTNDLNMLLKAQALGIDVERREDAADGSFARRYIVRPFQRYKVPLGILAMSVAVFAGVVAFAVYSSNLVAPQQTTTGVPAEFRDLLNDNERQLLDGLVTLQSEPNDPDTLAQVGNAYYNLHDASGDVRFARLGIEYYERYLDERSDDTDVRTDLATLLFYTGATDQAIQETTTVLQADPDHVQANFNLGIFYWRGRQDYQAAAQQFSKVIGLTEGSSGHDLLVYEDAKSNLEAVRQEAEEAGQPIELDGGTI